MPCAQTNDDGCGLDTHDEPSTACRSPLHAALARSLVVAFSVVEGSSLTLPMVVVAACSPTLVPRPAFTVRGHPELQRVSVLPLIHALPRAAAACSKVPRALAALIPPVGLPMPGGVAPCLSCWRRQPGHGWLLGPSILVSQRQLTVGGAPCEGRNFPASSVLSLLPDVSLVCESPRRAAIQILSSSALLPSWFRARDTLPLMPSTTTCDTAPLHLPTWPFGRPFPPFRETITCISTRVATVGGVGPSPRTAPATIPSTRQSMESPLVSRPPRLRCLLMGSRAIVIAVVTTISAIVIVTVTPTNVCAVVVVVRARWTRLARTDSRGRTMASVDLRPCRLPPIVVVTSLNQSACVVTLTNTTITAGREGELEEEGIRRMDART